MSRVWETGCPSAPAPSAPHRFAGWASIASGIVGLVAVVCLIAYLTTQAQTFMQSGVMPPLGRMLLTANVAGGLLQALLMIPAAIAVSALVERGSSHVSQAMTVVGCIGLSVVALLKLLLLLPDPAVSDILFMGPTGSVGVWLVVVNWLLAGKLALFARILGTIAGLGLVIVGVSFFFLGGLAVLSGGPFAYANDVDFHIGIAVGGVPGFILYPVWAVWLGRTLLGPTKFASVMKHAVAIAVLSLVMLMPGWAQSAGEIEKELVRLQNEWAAARVARDVDFLERLYAREFRITAMNGTIVERDDDIARFASGALKPESIIDEDLKVSVYGDVAVVTGRENMRGPYQGRSIELSVLFTNVFVRRDGRWQLVTHHSTPAAARH
jgi:ketosteroid isomerase-like protein